MRLFSNLTAEDVANQHHVLLDMILYVLAQGSSDLRSEIATSVEKMITMFEKEGMDSTILSATAASLRQQHDEAESSDKT